MTDYWVVTLMGDDQPLVIQALTDIVVEHQGSWLDSRIAQMADKFVGILGLSVPQTESANLQDSLENFAEMRELAMHIIVSKRKIESPSHIARVKITALDRPRIMQSISQILNKLGMNAMEVETHCGSAPWSNETHFSANIKLELSPHKIEAFQSAIENLGDDFIIDIEPINGSDIKHP